MDAECLATSSMTMTAAGAPAGPNGATAAATSDASRAVLAQRRTAEAHRPVCLDRRRSPRSAFALLPTRPPVRASIRPLGHHIPTVRRGLTPGPEVLQSDPAQPITGGQAPLRAGRRCLPTSPGRRRRGRPVRRALATPAPCPRASTAPRHVRALRARSTGRCARTRDVAMPPDHRSTPYHPSAGPRQARDFSGVRHRREERPDNHRMISAWRRETGQPRHTPQARGAPPPSAPSCSDTDGRHARPEDVDAWWSCGQRRSPRPAAWWRAEAGEAAG